MKKVIVVACIFIAGALAGRWYAKMSYDLGPQQQVKWMMYNQVYRPAVVEAVAKYFNANKKWPETPSDLVAGGYIPEWSEVFLPVRSFNDDISRKDIYLDRQYVTNSPMGIISNVRNAPYQFVKSGNSLIIQIKGEPDRFADVILTPEEAAKGN